MVFGFATFKEAAGLASAIRQICISETNIKVSEVNRAEKIQALYNYLLSSEFKQRIEAIIEAASEMRQNMNKQENPSVTSLKKQEISVDQMAFLMTDIVG